MKKLKIVLLTNMTLPLLSVGRALAGVDCSNENIVVRLAHMLRDIWHDKYYVIIILVSVFLINLIAAELKRTTYALFIGAVFAGLIAAAREYEQYKELLIVVMVIFGVSQLTATGITRVNKVFTVRNDAMSFAIKSTLMFLLISVVMVLIIFYLV